MARARIATLACSKLAAARTSRSLVWSLLALAAACHASTATARNSAAAIRPFRELLAGDANHQGPQVSKHLELQKSVQQSTAAAAAPDPPPAAVASTFGRKLAQFAGATNIGVGAQVAASQRITNTIGALSQLSNFYGLEGFGLRHRFGALPAPGGLELLLAAGPKALPGPEGFTAGFLGGTVEALASSVNPVNTAVVQAALQDGAAANGLGQLLGVQGLGGLGLNTGAAAMLGSEGLAGGLGLGATGGLGLSSALGNLGGLGDTSMLGLAGGGLGGLAGGLGGSLLSENGKMNAGNAQGNLGGSVQGNSGRGVQGNLGTVQNGQNLPRNMVGASSGGVVQGLQTNSGSIGSGNVQGKPMIPGTAEAGRSQQQQYSSSNSQPTAGQGSQAAAADAAQSRGGLLGSAGKMFSRLTSRSDAAKSGSSSSSGGMNSDLVQVMPWKENDKYTSDIKTLSVDVDDIPTVMSSPVPATNVPQDSNNAGATNTSSSSSSSSSDSEDGLVEVTPGWQADHTFTP